MSNSSNKGEEKLFPQLGKKDFVPAQIQRSELKYKKIPFIISYLNDIDYKVNGDILLSKKK